MSQIAIRGGTIIDGTGGPARRVDLGIRDGRVEEIGETVRGDEEIDASVAVLVAVAMVVVVAVAARRLQPGVDVFELHPAPNVERGRLDRPVDERARLPEEGHAHTPVEQDDADPRSGARERESLEDERVACGEGRGGVSGVGLRVRGAMSETRPIVPWRICFADNVR